MKLQEIGGISGYRIKGVQSSSEYQNEVREHVFAIARKHGYHPRLSPKKRNAVIILLGDEFYPIRNCLEMVMMEKSRQPQRLILP